MQGVRGLPDVLLRVHLGQAEPDRVVHVGSGKPDRLQRRRQVRPVGRTRAARGDVDALFLERMQQHFRAHARRRQADDMGRALSSPGTVDLNVRDIGDQRDKLLPQSVQSLQSAVQILIEHLGGQSHAGDAGHILRAGAHTVLLSAAEDQVSHPHFVGDIEEADALGRVDLVSADSQEVDAPLLGEDPGLAEPLHRVHVKEHGGILRLDQAADLLDGLDRADLVVGMHDGDKDRVIPDRVRHFLRGDDAPLVHGEIGHLKALLLQELHGFEDSGVLDLRRDQVPARPLIGQRAADDGDVVGLGSAGGEEDILLFDFQDLRQRPGGLRNVLLGLHALVVHAGGIAVLLQVYFAHQVHDLRKAPGRG